ncbi:RNA polymerase sigma factor [Marinobacter sp. F4218]|nr:RNA polymerase sigma factor [Marinobacter sp. F4218]
MFIRGIHLALLPFRQSKSKRFERLVHPHLRPLHTFAYRLTGSQHDAEDLVQDVVTKLFPKVDELERVEDLRPWLHRVLYRQFVDNVRKRPAGREVSENALGPKDQQTPFLETLPGTEPDPLTHTDNDRRSAILHRLIGELQPDQRTLLLLHDSEGWRQEDIAEILDVPLGTIKSRLHRVRALLRTKLQEEMEPFEEQQRGCQ